MFSYAGSIDGAIGSDDPASDVPRATPERSRNRSAGEAERADNTWLSIDAACKLLGVDQSTLRRWSDSGKIPVFRTPGGHRRYNEEDLRALVRGEPRRRRVSRQVLTTMSMSAYEHDYIRQAQSRPWYRAYDQRTLDELRPLGRRMVDLTIRYISSRGERGDIIAESREIGHEYGCCSARVGLSTSEALEAFLFFRNPVVQAVTHYIEDENVPTRRAARITTELTHFLDAVLIETVRAHQEGTED
ncbi:MAG TPA: helix-turn-helix domain-containing protein [Thermomicrobiales bacterium]|nr:helix-turn-helix domain-containing protein [Thermomicrobiales bacterium]